MAYWNARIARARPPAWRPRAVTLVLAMICSASAGCPEPGPSPGEVARVDREAITADDLCARFLQGPVEVRRRALSKGGRHYLLDLMIDETLLHREAERQKLAPAFLDIHEVHRQLMRRFLDAEFEPTVRASDISEEAVRAEYERSGEMLAGSEQRRIETVAVPTRERGMEVIADVRRALAGGDETTIQRALHPAGADYRGGQAGTFDRDGAETYLGADAARAAFALEGTSGVYPEPVRYQDRWAVVTVRIVLPGSPPPPFEQVEAQLRQRLLDERREVLLDRFVEGFRQHHRVVVDQEVSALVPWIPPEPTPDTPDGGASEPDGGTS